LHDISTFSSCYGYKFFMHKFCQGHFFFGHMLMALKSKYHEGFSNIFVKQIFRVFYFFLIIFFYFIFKLKFRYHIMCLLSTRCLFDKLKNFLFSFLILTSLNFEICIRISNVLFLCNMEPSKFIVAYVVTLVYQKRNCHLQLLFATTFWLQTFMNKNLFSSKQIVINS
jgi:hypothetical protein